MMRAKLVSVAVYHIGLLALTLTGLFRPDLVWASQSFYVALFSSFATLCALAWIFSTYKVLAETLAKMFRLGVPVGSVISFWGMLYFAALALAYQSQIFGFFAAVCLSGILSFGIYYRPGVLTLDFNEKALGAVTFCHLAVLLGYVGLRITGHAPAQTALFTAGFEYYRTIAMGVGFLVGASAFRMKEGCVSYLFGFMLILAAAVTGYFFCDFKVIGSILCCIGMLLALEWIGYLGYQGGFLFGTFVAGMML